MKKKAVIQGFKIINGKLYDPDYQPELHVFYKDKILECHVLIPGLIKESIHVFVKQNDIRIKAHIIDDYFQIFKARQIDLKLNLPEKVIENVVTVKYRTGILIIELARSS